jgi:hypothetical protein
MKMIIKSQIFHSSSWSTGREKSVNSKYPQDRKVCVHPKEQRKLELKALRLAFYEPVIRRDFSASANEEGGVTVIGDDQTWIAKTFLPMEGCLGLTKKERDKKVFNALRESKLKELREILSRPFSSVKKHKQAKEELGMSRPTFYRLKAKIERGQ